MGATGCRQWRGIGARTGSTGTGTGNGSRDQRSGITLTWRSRHGHLGRGNRNSTIRSSSTIVTAILIWMARTRIHTPIRTRTPTTNIATTAAGRQEFRFGRFASHISRLFSQGIDQHSHVQGHMSGCETWFRASIAIHIHIHIHIHSMIIMIPIRMMIVIGKAASYFSGGMQ